MYLYATSMNHEQLHLAAYSLSIFYKHSSGSPIGTNGQINTNVEQWVRKPFENVLTIARLHRRDKTRSHESRSWRKSFCKTFSKTRQFTSHPPVPFSFFFRLIPGWKARCARRFPLPSWETSRQALCQAPDLSFTVKKLLASSQPSLLFD